MMTVIKKSVVTVEAGLNSFAYALITAMGRDNCAQSTNHIDLVVV